VQTRRWAIAITSVALVAAGCSRSSSTNNGAAGTAPASAGLTSGDFGSLKAVCGPGQATGASAQGVTNTSIDIGTLADPGAAVRPGLDQELFDASTAFSKWCNAAGGILGRKINLHLRDAKLFEVQARMVEACQSDFMVVGGGTGLDQAGVSTRVGCKLAEIDAYDNSAEATEAPLQVQALPNPIQQQPVGHFRQIGMAFPDAIKHFGILTGDLPGLLTTRDRNIEGAQAVGYVKVDDELYPAAGVDNWRPYVENMKSKGVQVLTYVGEPANMAALEKSMKDVGYYPKAIILEVNHYDNSLWQDAADAIQNTWVRDYFYPFEEAKNNPATQQFVDIVHKQVPGGKIAALGLNSWTAWLLFAEAAKACGSQLTRQCVLDKAGAMNNWTGGGLHAPTNPDPSNRQSPSCDLLMKATPTGFVRDQALTKANNGIYMCGPENVIQLKGNYKPKPA
jgi:hypothetical protein